MPKIGCQQEAEISEDGKSLSAGWVDGEFPPEGVETLSNGVYCVNGDFILGDNQRLEGHAVVIKLEHGRIQFSGDAQFNLSAPGAGEYAGRRSLLETLPFEMGYGVEAVRQRTGGSVFLRKGVA